MNSDGALCVFDVKTKELREILDNTTFVSRNYQSTIKKTWKSCSPFDSINKFTVKGCFWQGVKRKAYLSDCWTWPSH